MSVHQTRAYFKRTLGHIVDNPEVGKQLTEVRVSLLSRCSAACVPASQQPVRRCCPPSAAYVADS